MGLARQLAGRIATMQYADLPPEAVHWGKVAVLDTIGVALAGAREDAPRILAEVVGAESSGPSLVLGSDRRVSALDAATLNGTAAHVLDFDNTVSTVGGHVSAVMVPALIAAGDAHASTGKDVLVAQAAGFEVARIGLALNPHHSEKGWHPTATLGVFAVTGACARLLGLNVDQTEIALAMAASLAAGIKANFGTMTKSLHAGQAARGGLMAALLACKGFTANKDAFEHKQGFLKLFSDGGQYDVARIFEDWGKASSIVNPGASYKLYPCCYSTHSAIQGALDLVRQHGVLDAKAIEKVETRTSSRALMHTDRAWPKSGLEAKFSVQYCVARALTSGEVVLDDFEENAWADEAVQSVLGKLQSTPYEGPFATPDRFDARVKVTLRDGRVLESKVDTVRGRRHDDPISADEMDAKFRDCAGRVLGADKAEAVGKQIWSLEAVRSVRDVTAMLETAQRLEAAA